MHGVDVDDGDCVCAWCRLARVGDAQKLQLSSLCVDCFAPIALVFVVFVVVVFDVVDGVDLPRRHPNEWAETLPIPNHSFVRCARGIVSH